MANDRPRLERWSWIAGIAGAIIAAVTLWLALRPTSAPTSTYSQNAGPGSTQIGEVNGSVTINRPGPDPQVVLNMSHEAFWESIERGDTANIERLAKGGMKLKPAFLQEYFSGHYTPETFAVLQRYDALPASGCPVDPVSLGFYVKAADDLQRARALRQVCGRQDVIAKLETARQTVSKRNDAAAAALARFPTTVAECRQQETGRRPVAAWYTAASQFMITSVNHYTLEQEILAKLNVGMISNQVTARNMEQFLAMTIEETCTRYNTPPKPNDQLLQSMDRALWLLKSA